MSSTRRARVADGDRGAAPVEMAIIGMVAIGMIGLLVVGGRVAIASSSIADVAGAAAREASIARSASQADQLARTSALAALRSQNLHCQHGPDVVVDVSGFAAPLGSPASIRVDVTCVVSLSDVALPGLPGARTVHDHAVSPLDPFRART